MSGKEDAEGRREQGGAPDEEPGEDLIARYGALEGSGALEAMFLDAVAARQRGDVDQARALLRDLLRMEPRLAEPYLELATLAGEQEDWEEAEALARTGLEQLRRGGQWSADVDEDRMLAFALNLLGESIMRQAEELVFGDAQRFRERWNEAAALFREALQHDPDNLDARTNAVHCRPLGPDGRPLPGDRLP